MTTPKALSKFAVSAAFAVLLVGWSVLPVHASHLNFTLYNDSRKSISYLYIAAASSDYWGQDVLGRDVLPRGAKTRITFPGQSPDSPCMWDMKFVFADGTSTVERFNLCKGGNIRVY